ncbi:hypothetical protein [Clostridium saccharoperbutylacetonicum]
MILILLGLFIYQNKKWKRKEKIAKMKLRFGVVISSIIMVLPCSLVLEPPFIVYLLKNIFRVKSEHVYPILVITTAVLFLWIIKFIIYVPLNEAKNE